MARLNATARLVSLGGALVAIAIACACLFATPQRAEAQPLETRKVLTVNYDTLGQLCLKGGKLYAIRKKLHRARLKNRNVAITIVAVSDANDFKGGRRFLRGSPCVKSTITDSISDHQRLALLRGLQIVEWGKKLGYDVFDGPTLLALDKSASYRNIDPQAVALIPLHSDRVGRDERRVEIWMTEIPGRSKKRTRKRAKPRLAPAAALVVRPLLLGAPGARDDEGAGGGAPHIADVAPALQEDWSPATGAGWGLIGAGAIFIAGGATALRASSVYEERAVTTLNEDRFLTNYETSSDLQRLSGTGIGLGVGAILVGAAFLVLSGAF